MNKVPNTLIEEILNNAAQTCDDAETYFVQQFSRSVVFESNKLREIQSKEINGIALRVIASGRTGITSTTNMSKAKETVPRAYTLSKFGPEVGFRFPQLAATSQVTTFDNSIENITSKQMVDAAQHTVEQVLSKHPKAQCSVYIQMALGDIQINNSSGLTRFDKFSKYSVVLSTQMINDTDMLHVWSCHTSCSPFDLNMITDYVAKPVNTALTNSQKIAKTPPNGTPVVFTPRGVSAALIEPLIEGFNGQKIVEKSSPLTNSWGKQVVGENISIRDNPLIDFNSQARSFDDEGVPCGITTLLDKGVAVSPLLDLRSSTELGMQSTGSARRSLTGLPAPSPSALEMSPGTTPLANITKHGKVVIVEDLLGAGQSNVLGGEYNANLSLGYLADNGEIIGRLKNTMVSGNVYETLKNTECLSQEREWVLDSVYLPYIRSNAVNVLGG